MKVKDLFKVSALPAIFASLCCLSPLVLVLFGLSSVAFASSLADVLYGDYKWFFRGAGLALLLLSIFVYFRKQKGICTLDQAKRRKREIINTSLLFLIAGVLGYVFFLYVVVHYAGVFLGLWENY
ncbi:MAG: TctA family transporter [Oceanicoccus sp.]|jgi:TctA family transporter